MKFKELREKNNLTQQKVSNAINVTQFTYSNYETGKTEPDIDTIKKMAKFYNVSIDYLLDFDNKNRFDLGYLTQDQKDAIKLLIQLNKLNFIKAYSYISGLSAGQE